MNAETTTPLLYCRTSIDIGTCAAVMQSKSRSDQNDRREAIPGERGKLIHAVARRDRQDRAEMNAEEASWSR